MTNFDNLLVTIASFHQNLQFCHRWRYKVPPLGGAVLANYIFKTLLAYGAAVPRHLGKKFQVGSKQPRVINGVENFVSSPLLSFAYRVFQ